MDDNCFSNSQSLLLIANNETIQSFLCIAAKDATLSSDLRRAASDLSFIPSLPYRSLRALWVALPPCSRPNLCRLFSRSDFIFIRPNPREKSEELKARLRKLSDLADRKAYNELVKDITSNKSVSEPFSSYRDQLGFGLHVALTMFTGYLIGYAAFRALFGHSSIMNAAGGLTGLVFGMLLETFIFMIKASDYDGKRPLSWTSKMKKNQ